jgi:hypothetical protein
MWASAFFFFFFFIEYFIEYFGFFSSLIISAPIVVDFLSCSFDAGDREEEAGTASSMQRNRVAIEQQILSWYLCCCLQMTAAGVAIVEDNG